MNIGIEAIEYYLPKKVISNPDLMERFDFPLDFLTEKLGIQKRPIAEADESCSDLAYAAAQKLFAKDNVTPKDIGLLLVCTQNPDYQIPHTAAILQDKLDLSCNIPAFDLNLGCSGFVYSLGIAKAFMELHGIECALVITSDPYSKIISPEDRNTLPLFGDAACATLLKKEGRFKILNFDFGTDGKGHPHLILENSGSRRDAVPVPAEAQGAQKKYYLSMNSRAIFSFMMTRIPASITNCLKMNNLQLEEIDAFVFHQASKYMIDSLRKRLSIDEKKVVIALRDTGNTVSSSIPIALSSYFQHKRPKHQKILLSGFGVGLSWASTVLSC